MAVKVGFIGAGGIASAHMSALQSVEDVQIVAVTDIDGRRAERAAAQYVAKPYTDYREMLLSEDLDAVYVCVPPFAHEDQETLAAERGIHIFVEKPVGLDVDRCRGVAEVIRKSGIISAAGYHWRYQSNTEIARETLRGKKIGIVQGYWMGGMPNVYWWRRVEQSGGQMVEQTTHVVDLARYLCGDIYEVYAAYSTRAQHGAPQTNVADVGTAVLKFANGAVGTIANSCMLNLPYTVGLHVVTEDTVVEIHGDLKIYRQGHTDIYTNPENPILLETTAFIEAVKTGDRKQIRSTYEDAVKTLAVTLACNESARTGEPVKISE